VRETVAERLANERGYMANRVMSDTQAIKDAYTEKLKGLYTVMADAFIGGENMAQAERDFQKAAKLARTARDVAIGLLPK
jgi:hypothetical protein